MAFLKKVKKNKEQTKNSLQEVTSSQKKAGEPEVNKETTLPIPNVQSEKVNIKSKKNKKPNTDEKNFGKKLTTRAFIVLGINIVGIIAIIIFMGKLPSQALELKRLKNSILTAEQSAEVNFADLELKSNKDLAEKLLVLFPDEVGLVGFVQEIEKLKKEGVVTNFSFANQTPVRDKTKHLGIPVAIEIEGNWSQISKALVDLQELPYLFRPVSMSAQPGAEGNIIKVRYGGFLYVDESLEEK